MCYKSFNIYGEGPADERFVSTIGFYLESHRPVSFVEVIDDPTANAGGIAGILSGGVNQTELLISLRSVDIGGPANFHVFLYAANMDEANNDFRFGRFSIGDIYLYR